MHRLSSVIQLLIIIWFCAFISSHRNVDHHAQWNVEDKSHFNHGRKVFSTEKMMIRNLMKWLFLKKKEKKKTSRNIKSGNFDHFFRFEYRSFMQRRCFKMYASHVLSSKTRNILTNVTCFSFFFYEIYKIESNLLFFFFSRNFFLRLFITKLQTFFLPN